MLLFDYLKKIELSNPIIETRGNVCRLFFEKNLSTLWDAIEYVYKLPYGRTTNRESYLQIFDEKRGACSTKHALIAALSEELLIPLKLTLGILLLTRQNTPKIAPILEYYHLAAIPEAHCYLKYNNNILDITFPNELKISLDGDFQQEINITPHQIGSFKIEKHQAFIRAWIKNKSDLSFDLVWAAREEWISKLNQGSNNIIVV